MPRFTEIWLQTLQIETAQAIWSLYRAGLNAALCYVQDIRDLGDPQILWECIVESHRQVAIVQAGGIPSLEGLSALRYRAIRSALEHR
jgi:hypothetical protein